MKHLWTKEDYWYAHLRFWNNIQLFPREFGLYRTQVYKPEYFFLLSTNYNRINCYTSVYSVWQIENNVYDTLFIEARDDTEDLDQIIMDRDFIRGAFEKHGIAYRSHFSGNNSYHFYTDFPPMPVPNLSSMARNFVTEMDIWDLLDKQIVGNKRGVGRIPYTWNEGGGKYAVCSLTNDGTELDYIAANGIMDEPPVRELQPTNILKYLNTDAEDYTAELMKPSEFAFDGIYPDCVLSIMDKIHRYKHAGHQERIHLASYLFKLGHSMDEIIDSFRETSDFNPAVTQYQVYGIMGANYNPYSCARVKREMPECCPYSKTGAYCGYIKKLAKKTVANEVLK